MSQQVATLRQAYQFINDKSVFHCIGRKEDQLRLKEMLNVLLQTRVGRALIVDIGKLVQSSHDKSPVLLAMRKPEKRSLAQTNEYLEVEINRISLKDMTPKQKRRSLLMQSITLIHELAHVRQFLKGYETYIQKFSVPHQIYANILEELDASLVDHSFEIEAARLYPYLSRDMHLWHDRPGWRRRFAQTFFTKNPNQQVPIWIDLLADFVKDIDKFALNDKSELKCFSRWVDSYFQKMQLPFRYGDFPMEKVFWVEKQPDGFLKVMGNNNTLLFDRQGRLVVFGDGFEKKKESALKFSVFTYKGAEGVSQKLVNQIKGKHPKANIFVAQGGKKYKFSAAHLMKKLQKEQKSNF